MWGVGAHNGEAVCIHRDASKPTFSPLFFSLIKDKKEKGNSIPYVGLPRKYFPFLIIYLQG